MAAIGKIREQSTLLLIVIGGAMVAFVLGDLFSNRGGNPGDQYVGEVYGEEINMLEYEQRVESEKQAMSSIGQPVTSSDQQIRNQVWNDMIQEKIMYNELNRLGMRIGQEEYDDIRFGENANSEFRTGDIFKDQETGQFDPTRVQNYFSVMQSDFPLYYEIQQNRIVNQRLYEKYNNMIKKGIVVNTLEAKDEYYREEQKVDFTYVVQTFASVPDSTIEVSDADLKAYYDKHKHEERFEQDAQVDLDYVVFDVGANEKDKENIRLDLADLKTEFANSTKDSLFVLKYSDTRNAAITTLEAGGDSALSAMIDSAEEGDVIGPFEQRGKYAIAKVVSIGSKELATARHILLSKESAPDMKALHARADSLVKVIKKQDNFEDMVREFSDDPGSIQNGGVYESFDRQQMVPEFTEASFDKPIGSINIVETTYGIHIVEPLKVTEEKVVNVWEVDAEIRPSSDTFNSVYDEANEFSLTAENLKGFESLANERGYEIKEGNKINPMATNLPGVQNSQEAVRWAHKKENTKVGAVSEPMEFNRKIVVTALKARRDKGLVTFEDIKDQIKPDVVRDKKSDKFKKEMEGKNIADLEQELGLSAKMATNISEERPTLPGNANEPYVVGFALTMAEGNVSRPLVGKAGVYVLHLDSKTDVQPREEYLTYKDELEDRRQSQMQTYSTGVYRALRELANVKDERSRLFQ